MRIVEKVGIRGSVLALAIVAVGIGIAVASLVVVRAVQLDRLVEAKERLDALLPRVKTIAKLVADLETEQRDYVVTGDPTLLEPFHAAAHDLPRLIGETRAALAPDPVGLEQLARIDALAARWIEEAGEPAIAARRRAPGPVPDAATADMLRAQAGRAVMDQLRAAVAELDRTQQGAAAAVHREMHASLERMIAAIPVATALGCILVLALAAWTGQGLRRRIEQVAEQGEQMADGEIETPAGVAERNEAGRLLRAYARLGLTLKAQTAETKAAQRRAALLAQATQRLGVSLDIESTLNEVAALAVPTLADWCIVDLLEEDETIRRVAVAHADPARHGLVPDVLANPPDAGGPHPAAVAMRTRKPQLGSLQFGSTTDGAFTTPAHLDVARRVGTRSYLAVPLVARDRTVGALSFLYADSGRCYEPSDVAIAEELARRAAVSIDNARLYAASQRAEARAGFLVEATARANASLDLEATLGNIAALLVPTLADGCIIDLLALDGRPPSATVAHVDPEKAEQAREIRGRHPLDPAGRSPIALAIQTRQPQVRSEVTDAAFEAYAQDPAHLEILRSLAIRSIVTAPLEARGRILGSLTLVSARPDRRFRRADIALAGQVARQVALSVDNALLYREAVMARGEARRQAELTSAITSNLGEGVVALDTGGRVAFLNRAASEMLGWRETDLLGQTLERTFHPEHVAQDGACRLLEGLETGRIVRHEDDVLVAKGGQPLSVSLTASPIFVQGPFAGSVLVFRDVSQRLALEARLREVHKMEAVGQLAGGIAHDFNNILTAILGYSELLGRSVGADDRVGKGLEEIRKAAERAAGLTRQLLAFGRKQRLAPAVVDLGETLARLRPALQRVVGEQVTVEVRHREGIGRVKVDPRLLEEALTRLAMNARDAMPTGGRFAVETANASLDQAYATTHADARPGAYVRLTVRDTGSGMDETTLAHAFEPFYTTKEVGQGSGLGLAMVHGFVSQSGGHVAVESRVGAGTAFHIYLPRVDEPSRTAPVQPGRRGAAPAVTVLLVDDEEALRSIARIVLEDAGYRVLEAENGEKALAVAAAHAGTIDLLLTDVVMPGMNGRQLAERLTALRPGTGVLYMSGYSDDVLDEAGGLGPGSAFLEKPFSPEVLLRKVAAALETAARL